MRHRRHIKHFSRLPHARKALIRGLVRSLVEHERIHTTLDKAKELRRHVERAVTAGKKGDLNAHRLLMSRYPHKDTVSKLVNDLGKRFKDRPGGYTRIIKLGKRLGDSAEMAFIEFVDFDHTAERKSSAPSEKDIAKRHLKKRKVLRKIQNEDRKILRRSMA